MVTLAAMVEVASLPTAPLSAVGDPQIGKLIGERYRLTARLGEGGMADTLVEGESLPPSPTATSWTPKAGWWGRMRHACKRMRRRAFTGQVMAR